MLGYRNIQSYRARASELESTLNKTEKQREELKKNLDTTKKDLSAVTTDDQYVLNKQLTQEIQNIHEGFGKTSSTYEKLLDLKSVSTKKYNDLDQLFADILHFLSDRNYGSAQSSLAVLDKKIQTERASIVASFSIPQNVAVNNTAPSSGYSPQRVQIDAGEYLVDIVAADMNSTRVIVDTATDGDCANDCPVLSLADYVSRNGAFAGINGSYFCPADYPSCAGKKNSFDTLAMNKNKKYINSANNVYSTVPAVIFLGNSARFVGRSLEWGRDTGVDAVLANYPLLVLNGQIMTGPTGNGKQDSRGPRSFVGASGSTAYIGIVHNASVAEAAAVLNKLGVQSALNLDSGGSTALWSGGYKAGPGRNIPNALLFVRK